MPSVLRMLPREAQSARDTAVPLVGPRTLPLGSGMTPPWLRLLGLSWQSRCSSPPPGAFTRSHTWTEVGLWAIRVHL